MAGKIPGSLGCSFDAASSPVSWQQKTLGWLWPVPAGSHLLSRAKAREVCDFSHWLLERGHHAPARRGLAGWASSGRHLSRRLLAWLEVLFPCKGSDGKAPNCAMSLLLISIRIDVMPSNQEALFPVDSSSAVPSLENNVSLQGGRKRNWLIHAMQASIWACFP